ncbi:hypothetical protein BaRGS_00015000, partial [Batillaria attramentaria]
VDLTESVTVDTNGAKAASPWPLMTCRLAFRLPGTPTRPSRAGFGDHCTLTESSASLIGPAHKVSTCRHADFDPAVVMQVSTCRHSGVGLSSCRFRPDVIQVSKPEVVQVSSRPCVTQVSTCRYS